MKKLILVFVATIFTAMTFAVKGWDKYVPLTCSPMPHPLGGPFPIAASIAFQSRNPRWWAINSRDFA